MLSLVFEKASDKKQAASAIGEKAIAARQDEIVVEFLSCRVEARAKEIAA